MFNIGPTPFDLRLVAFRIPIRVHPSFWLATALFGWEPDHLQVTFIWVMCAFVSILVHELGHAFAAEAFGWPSEILLYFGGGLTFSARNHNATPWRSIFVSFMGPAAGFMLFGLLVGTVNILGLFDLPHLPYLWVAISILIFMNLYWGLLNLLPVLPLDGGQICRSLCEVTRLRNPGGAATLVSVVVGGAAAYYFFAVSHQQFAGMLMLMLCLQNYFALQARR